MLKTGEGVLGSKLLVPIFFAVISLLFFLLFSITLFNSGMLKAISTESNFEVNVGGMIELSVTNCDGSSSSVVDVDILPSTSGAFNSACQTIMVNTNSPGYTLTARASTSDLVYQNPTNINPSPVIPSTINTITSPSVLEFDTWGFAVENSNNFNDSYTIGDASNKYAQLSTNDTSIYSTDQWPIPKTDHTFYYGTMLTANTMAGIYTTTIIYSAIASNVQEIPTYPLIGEGAYFQDRTRKVNESCSSLAIYDPSKSEQDNQASTVVMIDSRNNQEYRVRRLQDGRCWMIDSLKLELTNGMTLTPFDTNVAVNTNIYFTQDGTSAGIALTGMTGNFTTSGYMTRSGTSSSTSPNYDAWRQANPGNVVQCLNNTSSFDNSITIAYPPNSKTKCGYLYNFYTATAGVGKQSFVSGEIISSICPVGWRLPHAGGGYADTNNELAILHGAMAGTGPNISVNSTTLKKLKANGEFQGASAGFYRGGFSSQGNTAYYWYSTGYSNAAARIYTVTPTGANLGSVVGTKNDGYSVRCIMD